MKRTFLIFITVIILFTLCGCYDSEFLAEIEKEGYDKGYDNGYYDGHSEGYDEGYEEGHDTGYDDFVADHDTLYMECPECGHEFEVSLADCY